MISAYKRVIRFGWAIFLVFAPALAIGGTQAQIRIEQAKVKFSAGEYQQALDLLDQVIEEEPENAEAYHYLGLCQMGLSRPGQAMRAFARSAELDPDNAGAWEDLAWAALEAGDAGTTLSAAETALEIDPQSPRALFYKGRALIELRRFEQALEVFDTLSGSETHAQAALFYSGICMIYTGRIEDGRAYFERCRDLDPETDLGREAARYIQILDTGEGVPAPERPWSIRARLLFQYDTNIVPVNGDDFLPEEISEMEDGRGVLDLDARYKYLMSGRGDAYVRYYGYSGWQFQEQELNIMYHQGELGGNYRLPGRGGILNLAARASYAGSWIDNEQYSVDWAISPEASATYGGRYRIRMVIDYVGEEFEDIAIGQDIEVKSEGEIFDRDNVTVRLNLYQHLFLLDGRVNSWAGYALAQVDADGKNYNRKDTAYQAGVIAALPRESLLVLIFNYEQRRFPDYDLEKKDSLGNVIELIDREENRTTVNASFQYPLNQWLSLYLGAVYFQVDSNFEELEYERWIYSAGMMAGF